LVTFSDNAISDLTEIREWIAQDSPSRASEKAQIIIETCRLLDSSPKIGRELADGTRKFTKRPWIIIYELKDDGPYIIHVWDGRRNWQAIRR